MKIKKICILRAGDVTYISRIHRAALALQECGNYNVTIISINPRNGNDSKKYPYEIIKLPIKTRVLKSKIFLVFRIIEGLFRVYNQARKQKADIYMPIAVEDLFIAYIITKFSKSKLVYNANELEGARKLFSSKILQKIANKIIRNTERNILKKADCVIAADIERGKVMEEWYKLKKVEIVRNVPLYQECMPTRFIHEKLCLKNELKIILYQGILSPGRGLEISIIASSKTRNQNLALVLLGDIDSNYKMKLIQIAKENNFEHLYFISAVPWQDLLNWTASADISLVLIENVSLSYYLAAPNKLYESIMAEVPYIASNFPEINHVHKIADAGILVNPENSNEIADAIDKLLEDEKLTNLYKANANYAKKLYNWDVEKNKLISIIDKL